MLGRLRPRLTFANVTSVLALFVALGGSGYAATKINGSSIKNRSIAGKKLKRKTLTGAEIKNGSLTAANFASGQLPPGPRGPQGDQGPKGDQGPAGQPALRLWAHIAADGTVDAAQSSGVAQSNVTYLNGEATYCFHGLALQPQGGEVTIGYSGNSSNRQFAQFDTGAQTSGCPAGTQAFVYIEDVNQADSPAPFFIAFYG